MKFLLKIVILLVFISTTILFASYLDIIKNSVIDNQTILLITLIALCLLLALLVLKRKKIEKKEKESKIKESSDNDIHNYLSDNIKASIWQLNEVKDLTSAIKESGNLDRIDELLYRENELLYTIKETEIFLDTITNKAVNKVESFNLEKFIKELHCYCTSGSENKEFNIIPNGSLHYSIIANKELLENIIILLAKLQYKEHNLSEANINLKILPDNNFLEFSVSNLLRVDEKLKEVLNNNLKPIYDYDKKRYVGIYLYLISLLVNRFGGKLRIDLNENNYKIYIDIPINIERTEERAKLLLPDMAKENKRALIISNNSDIANSITSFLENYNIKTEAVISSNIEKTPNFMGYDILLIDASLLEPILSDYLVSIKKYHDLKIISIESSKKKYEYISGLVDYVIKKPILQSKIYQMIVELYHNKKEEPSSLQERSILKSNKKNRVLIIENSTVNMKLLKYMIESYGIEVISASNKQEAFELLESRDDFDLIIIDSAIENNGSCETIQKIRQNEKFNSIPVIIHSAFSRKMHNIEDIFKLGFDSYLPKPFTKHKLQAILERYLNISFNQEESITLNEEEVDRVDLDEFLAIYSDSDKIIEKYLKEDRIDQAVSMIKDLKNIALKIKEDKLLEVLDKIEKSYKKEKNINSDLLYELSTVLKETKEKIIRNY